MTSETRWNLGVAALILIAVVRIVATYHVFSATIDEPDHIACGMEWIDLGTYHYEFQHPPVARVMMAVGPYLMGARSMREPEMIEEGVAILYSKNDHRLRLALARMGNLPFLILGAVVVWRWGKRWFGNAAGLWAVLLFLSLPPILAHAGLATLDMAATTSCALALYELIRWREDPTMRRAIVLSIAIALALLCKFSIPAFLVACAAIGLFGLPGGDFPKLRFLSLLKQAAAGIAIVLLLVLVVYRFHTQPIISPEESANFTNVASKVLGQNAQLVKAAARVSDIPLPFGGLLRGFADVFKHNALGHEAYLLGKYSKSGFWNFFLVVLSVKTPIGFSLLALAGTGMILLGFRHAPWQHRVTALFPLAILLVCMSSHINIGVRHILPIYAPLAVVAGHAAAWLFSQRKTQWIAVVVAGWVVVASWIVHPDYLAYFNEIAGSHPEKIIVDSDLDWGQDLDRLGQRLRELHVDHLGLKYFGHATSKSAGIPAHTHLDPHAITEGYVAISVRTRETDYAHDRSWAWLRDRQPLERIGKSIDLYYVVK